MNAPEPNKSLVDHIVARITDVEVTSIRRSAPEVYPGDMEFRENSLIMSGVALGVEHAQSYALGEAGRHIELIQNTLIAINRQIAMHLDDPSRMEFLRALRQPILDSMRSYVDQLIAAACDDANRVYGIEPQVMMSRNHHPAYLAAVPDTAAGMQPTEFLGFLLHTQGDIYTNSPMLQHLFQMSGYTHAEVMRMGAARYGSIAAASAAFTSYVLLRTWARMDDLEETMGLNTVDEADIIGDKTTETLLYLRAGVPLPRDPA